jgi:phosphatidate cytidylyltransferase
MNNFIKRTLSGALFVAIIIGSILIDSKVFAGVFAIITALAVREFHMITNRQTDVNPNSWLGAIGGALLFVTSYLHASNTITYPIFSIYGLYVVIALLSELYLKKKNPIHNWAYFILGQVIIALPFSLLNFISFIDDNSYKPLILLAVFITIWVNDTGAYLFGITLGKHRLFERISPKKSWEGFFGGALAALVSGYVFSLIIPEITLIHWLIFSEIIVVFGTFGDLNESLLKRTLQVKDSGNAIPGHGGFLDRFDSMLLAAPVIFIYLSFIF